MIKVKLVLTDDVSDEIKNSKAVQDWLICCEKIVNEAIVVGKIEEKVSKAFATGKPVYLH